MTKRIVVLLALVGMSGPAFGQIAGMDALTPDGASRSVPPVEVTADIGPNDCAARYRSMRARGDMLPSQRRAALDVCRTAANAQEQESLARKTD